MVVRGRTRNPSGCFAGCLHITRGNVNFDVLTGFRTCLNDAFSNNILTATVPSFKADLRYTNRKFAMKIYLEMYRSGRNENDSKSFCPEMGTWVRIPPSPPTNFLPAAYQAAGFLVCNIFIILVGFIAY